MHFNMGIPVINSVWFYTAKCLNKLFFSYFLFSDISEYSALIEYFENVKFIQKSEGHDSHIYNPVSEYYYDVHNVTGIFIYLWLIVSHIFGHNQGNAAKGLDMPAPWMPWWMAQGSGFCMWRASGATWTMAAVSTRITWAQWMWILNHQPTAR